MPIDLRFTFKRNPYSSTQESLSQQQSSMFMHLQEYIRDHASEFTAVDPISGIRYVQLEPPKDFPTLDGVKHPYDHTEMDDFKYISANIKHFLVATGMKLCDPLQEWVGPVDEGMDACDIAADDSDDNGAASTITGGAATTASQAVADSDTPLSIPTNIVENLPSQALASINIGMNYDSTSDKRLDYSEVCRLCLNIARVYNTNKAMKDPSVVAIENKRRRDLMNDISRYRKNKIIAATCSDDDLSRMSLEQLETNLTQCKEIHNRLKLKEVSRNTLSILGDAYDAIFPNGIPLGKGRHMQFNGVGDEIIKDLHNPTTAVGLSYDNFISKHNIHIADELSIVAAIGTILIRNIRVTKDTPDDHDDASDDDGNSDEGDEGIDEEEDIDIDDA